MQQRQWLPWRRWCLVDRLAAAPWMLSRDRRPRASPTRLASSTRSHALACPRPAPAAGLQSLQPTPSSEAALAASEAGDSLRGRQLGRVALLKKEFGFIRQVDRPGDMFFHFSQLDGWTAEGVKVWLALLALRTLRTPRALPRPAACRPCRRRRRPPRASRSHPPASVGVPCSHFGRPVLLCSALLSLQLPCPCPALTLRHAPPVQVGDDVEFNIRRDREGKLSAVQVRGHRRYRRRCAPHQPLPALCGAAVCLRVPLVPPRPAPLPSRLRCAADPPRAARVGCV